MLKGSFGKTALRVEVRKVKTPPVPVRVEVRREAGGERVVLDVAPGAFVGSGLVKPARRQVLAVAVADFRKGRWRDLPYTAGPPRVPAAAL
ncbi:MAG: hypothetical protein AAB427_02205 [Chloroflexota bacterium]